MLHLHTCQCGQKIETKWNGKVFHATCPHCKTRYQLDVASRRLYMVITPLVVVALIVLNRLVFQFQDIAVLALYILGGSYLIAHGIHVFLVKVQIFRYEVWNGDK
ncbi:MAG: hypothetical protein ACRDBX_01465 [Erysipelotrichaceae bacterium]